MTMTPDERGDATAPRWSMVSFNEAIAETASRRRHLLLGNGFSMGTFSGFAYGSLVEEASRDQALAKLFVKLGNPPDFEEALARARQEADKQAIREGFAKTIARIHPRRNPAISSAGMSSCAKFLDLFLRGGRRKKLAGKLFTTNYDFVLCWVLVDRKALLHCADGFDRHGNWHDRQEDYPTRVYYLHGGLHVFGTGRPRIPVRKVMADDARGLSLPQVVREAVLSGQNPIMVAEGTSEEKKVAISNNPYLCRAKDEFWQACSFEEDALFVFGHGLKYVDNHLVELIGKSRIRSVFVSVFDADAERRLSELADVWTRLRAERGRGIDVKGFRPQEAQVWNGHIPEPVS